MALDGFHARLLVEGAVFATAIWTYRKNRVIAFGGIVLALVGMMLLGMRLGLPDWFVGAFALIFLLSSVAFFLFACFAACRFAYLRLRKARTPR